MQVGNEGRVGSDGLPEQAEVERRRSSAITEKHDVTPVSAHAVQAHATANAHELGQRRPSPDAAQPNPTTISPMPARAVSVQGRGGVVGAASVARAAAQPLAAASAAGALGVAAVETAAATGITASVAQSGASSALHAAKLAGEVKKLLSEHSPIQEGIDIRHQQIAYYESKLGGSIRYESEIKSLKLQCRQLGDLQKSLKSEKSDTAKKQKVAVDLLNHFWGPDAKDSSKLKALVYKNNDAFQALMKENKTWVEGTFGDADFKMLLGLPKLQPLDASGCLKQLEQSESSGFLKKLFTNLQASEAVSTIISPETVKDYNRSFIYCENHDISLSTIRKKLQQNLGKEREPTKNEVEEEYTKQINSFVGNSLKEVQKQTNDLNVNALRCQIQDLATQRLFALDVDTTGTENTMFGSMNMEYFQKEQMPSYRILSNAQDLAALGVPKNELTESDGTPQTGFSSELQYFIKREGDTIKITGMKKFIIVSTSGDDAGRPVGFDAMKVEISIDLKKLDPSKLLSDQQEGCVTGTYSRLGFKTNWNDVQF